MVDEFGRKRNIEHLIEQLDITFNNQDFSPPILLNPVPKTFEELLKIDPLTAQLIATAGPLLRFLNMDYQQQPSLIFLVGGIGSEILASEYHRNRAIRRRHKDLDFLVPINYIPILQHLFQSFGGLREIGKNIYRTKTSNNFGLHPDIVNLFPGESIPVDLFAYDLGERSGVGTFSGGTYDIFHFNLWESQGSDKATQKLRLCKLFGYDFPLLEEPIMKMKELDAKTRDKGALDYKLLRYSQI